MARLGAAFANVLNSASRVSVPLFFMISGYLFFGERSAQPRHFLRIGLCLFFYSAIALLYIALFTSINVELALKNLLQKPVFYHLWFFPIRQNTFGVVRLSLTVH